MAILTSSTVTTIDMQKIAKGAFIRAKYHTWRQPYNGIVANVTESVIRVLYIGDGGNITNYFVISADEIEQGLWALSWSDDLTVIYNEPELQETDSDAQEDG